MSKLSKLELTWIGKENRPKLEPRILLEDPEKSYHAPRRVTDHDLFDNLLNFGDNLGMFLANHSRSKGFAGGNRKLQKLARAIQLGRLQPHRLCQIILVNRRTFLADSIEHHHDIDLR
jgi:hypothetical protein